MAANNDRNGEISSRSVGPSSPFYLHPSNNPGVIISSMVLRGDNYDEWAKAHAAQSSAGHEVASNAVVTDGDRTGLSGLNDEQWQALASMLNAYKTRTNEILSSKNYSIEWIIDSGASHHMTGNLNVLVNTYDVAPCPIRLPNGAHTEAVKEGIVELGKNFKLLHILYIPKLNCNLLSVGWLLRDIDCIVTFTNKLCVIQDHISRTLIGEGEQLDGVYVFKGVAPIRAYKTDGIGSCDLWHRRLGQPSYQTVSLLLNISNSKNKMCDVCLKAKQTRDVFIQSSNKVTDCFALIHCDLWGAYRVPASCGAAYFFTIVEDYSRVVWIYLLAEKIEVGRTLKNLCTMIERQFNKKVKVVRSDNGTKFKSLKSYFDKQGILFQTSCVGTPKQNDQFLVAYVSRIFGTVTNLPLGVGNVSLLGTLLGKKGWKLYDFEYGDYFISRDMVFSEAEFPFATLEHQPSVTNPPSESPHIEVRGSDTIDEGHQNTGNDEEAGPPDKTRSHTDCRNNETPAAPQPTTELLGHGHREKRTPNYLQDFVTHSAHCLDPSVVSPASSQSSGIPYPITHYVTYDNFSVKHRHFLASITAGREPTRFFEAMTDARWREAMRQEIQALEDNGTWTLEDLPPGKKAIECKWVYKIKYNSDGSVEKFKARLVVLGNTQVEGLDYNETFTPVDKMVTVRTFLAVAAAQHWELHQMDVNNVFLHGDFHEEVYMKPPSGFSTYGTGKCPRIDHWDAALCVVRYLKGRPGQGIFLRSDSDLQLCAYCDSDWDIPPSPRRLRNNILSPVPLSRLNNRSMATASCELKWLKGLLLSLGISHPQPIRLFCDNQAALHIAANPIFHERTKHIEVDCHFIHNELQASTIAPAYVRTGEQLADIFTKALGQKQFDFFLPKLGICNPHAPP
ncbi:PREDICTED: uncharacterized protein LOC104586844 [Nelumbo nucifera]|uniref:Uncharacterized protein LOC104586844 n=1 Tax=Nelumbo nucifera TaxID=4432 RepID=A0A1U7YWZ6_NELNU|nr:PREDICTED: uncharacterized protein LOC104586844 [Nelumbo nucifera]